MSDNSQEINLFDLVLRKKNFLTNEECNQIIREYNLSYEYGVEQSSNRYGNKKLSTFSVIVLDPISEIGQLVRFKLAQAVDLYIDYLCQFNSFHHYSLTNYAFRYAHRLRVLRYGVGEKINQHVDHTIGTYGSCTMNLSGDYTGGEFVFLNGRKKIKLEQGELMMFPADFFWVHETMPVISGERFTFNCFLSSLPNNKTDKIFENIIGIPYEEPTQDKNNSVLIPLNRDVNIHEAY